jgi:hypothetical protein
LIAKQDVEDLVRRTDLEEETILDVMRILKEEFDRFMSTQKKVIIKKVLCLKRELLE